MFRLNHGQGQKVKAIALALAVSAFAPLSIISPVSAQFYRYRPYYYPYYSAENNPIYAPWSYPQNANYNYAVTIPAGTTIPVRFEEADKILVTKEEILPLTLIVAENIRNRSGNIVIPSGSEIVGQIQPAANGSQFVAEYLMINQDEEIPLSANSSIITRTEVIDEGTNTDAIWQGALAGAAAATVLAGVTGDTAIATEEVLGGAGFGALAGLLFGGQYSQELISIYPNQDLDITLQSDLLVRR
jgi:hypothetical protein